MTRAVEREGFGAVHGHLAGAATRELTRRVEQVDEALDVGGERLDPAVAARIAVSVAQVRERLELGVDHTIVALLGGTGSGKSSLFNAVCGLEFADVGVKRPTTSEVSACVWGEGGEALLDWLGVDVDRRIERESLLDGETEAPLRGLVLLDLPDHDSIAPAHRVVVDRLVPMADLLVWVVDPQKYADDALHSGYLRHLVGHEASMVVVLNQVDTLGPDVRNELVVDLARLLVEDGLEGVAIRTASARTGEGVPELRDQLAAVVARRSVAAERAGAELNDAATLLGSQVAGREPGSARLDVTHVVDVLTEAAGLRAIADAVGAVVRGGARAVPAFGLVQTDTVALARAGWLASVTRAVPVRWQEAVAARVASADQLRREVDDVLAHVTVATRRSRLATGLFASSLVVAGCALAAGSVALGLRLGRGSGTADDNPWAWLAAAALLGGAVLLAVGAHVARRAAARRRSERVLREGRAALEGVARRLLADPTVEVFAEHRRVRELADAVTAR
ncbi:MAG TPA: GTPase [Cellulomonas sp.]|uniref:GTPase n=1 Tax=Cellulomonas sp. TaxID=40001 RepID=UPI002E3388E1|nr:GTPase [Cellulomonas sp.]HEX5333990.1 GTPase [Cellulomonas sp.]